MNKKTFLVEIRETLCTQLEIRAKTSEEAYRIVEKQYDNEEIILDSGDFLDKEIEVLEEV